MEPAHAARWRVRAGDRARPAAGDRGLDRGRMDVDMVEDASHARQAAHDDTGLFFSCPDVEAAYAYLRGKGVDVQPPKIAPYGMKQLYVTDPDGYVLCFQWPAA